MDEPPPGPPAAAPAPQVQKPVIAASEVISHLVEQEGGLAAYELTGHTITGRFDLRHRVVPLAVIIADCDFADAVDLTFCEFTQAVSFPGCQFRQAFYAGSEHEGFLICKKDMLFDRCTFFGAAIFNDLQCGGSGYFEHATFFGYAMFGGSNMSKGISFNNSVFKGGAMFNSIKCGTTAQFHATTFEDAVGEVDFQGSSFGNNIELSESVFNCGANFGVVKCGVNFGAENAHFNNNDQVVRMDMLSATVLTCNGSVFAGGISAAGINCDRVWFQGCRFERQEDPGQKEKPAAKEDQEDQEAQGNLVDFSYAKIGRSFMLSYSSFARPVQLESVEVAGSADFQAARFADSFSLRNAKVTGRANFQEAEIHGALILRDASFGQLTFGGRTTAADLTARFMAPRVDVAGMEMGAWSDTDWKVLTSQQDSGKFSRDPYLQLERYYRKAGDDAKADQIYYEGRCALRAHARDPGLRHINWSKGRLLGDWLLDLLTGYGVRSWRLVVFIVFLIVAGTIVFWPDDALETKPAATAASVQQAAQPDPMAHQRLAAKAFYRPAYSMEQFMPVIKIGLTDRYQPRSWRRAYAVCHQLMGWLLVPLLAASLGGLLKRTGSS